MGNMSYCRFQKTEHDLRDCRHALEELFEEPSLDVKLSKDELAASKSLAEECIKIVNMISERDATPGVPIEQGDVERVLDDANQQAADAEPREEE